MASPAARTRILVAEDEAIIRLDLVETLTELGYEVVAAVGDGVAAVEQAHALRPDLVILDVAMPLLDGVSAAEQIAGVAPVLMLTAFSQRELVQRAAGAGAMAYLVKPYSSSDLVPAIEVALSRHREAADLMRDVEGLQSRLDARVAIDRAKPIVMARMGLSEQEAFRWIQRSAMDRRCSMADIAHEVLASRTASGSEPPESENPL